MADQDLQKLKDVYTKVKPKVSKITSANSYEVKSGAVKWHELVKGKDSDITTAKDGFFFLLSNALLLCDPEDNSQHKLVYYITLKASLRILDVAEPDQFRIVTDKKTFCVFCDSNESKDDWVKFLRCTQDGFLPPKFKEVDGEQVWDIEASLVPSQFAKFNELKKKIQERDPPLTEAEQKFVTDGTIIRYIRARSWDVAKAYQQLAATLEWRANYKPAQTEISTIEAEASTGKCYISSGKDKLGRIIVNVPVIKDNSGYSPEKVRFFVRILEECLVKMNTMHTGNHKSIWLVDFKDINKKKKGDEKGGSATEGAKTGIEIVKIFQAHYPETLGRAFLIDAPSFFSFCWKLITPFIDPVTQRKIIFVDRKKNIAEMLDYFDSTELEQQFNGTNDFTFDYDTWKQDEKWSLEKL